MLLTTYVFMVILFNHSKQSNDIHSLFSCLTIQCGVLDLDLCQRGLQCTPAKKLNHLNFEKVSS